MQQIMILLAALSASASADAESMVSSIRAGWSTYIFVSTAQPQRDLVSLAREAVLANGTLVFRGFSAGQADPIDMQRLQQLVAEVTAACCGRTPVSWIVDPRLYDRYHVTVAPSFVIANGTGAGATDYSLIAGDMALANALKFFAKSSSVPAIRARAAALYIQAFEGRQ